MYRQPEIFEADVRDKQHSWHSGAGSVSGILNVSLSRLFFNIVLVGRPARAD
jgi:hypothetical protein